MFWEILHEDRYLERKYHVQRGFFEFSGIYGIHNHRVG